MSAGMLGPGEFCPFWTTREGDLLPLHEMTSLHIQNCLRMLRRPAGAD